MAGRNQRAAASQTRDSVPESSQMSPPIYSTGADHSFTLQAIMEMQKTLGGMAGEIRAMTAGLEKVECRLEKLEEKTSSVTHKIYAATAILGILVAVGGFVISKAWDLAAVHLAELAKAAVGQQPRALPPEPPPRR